MPFTPAARHGILHHYQSRLVAFEHGSASSDSTASPNYLFFLGGLGDGLSTVNYPADLAAHFATTSTRPEPSQWRVVEFLLSSSYTGWTTSSLARDASEVALAVSYFRRLQGVSDPLNLPGDHPKIVLMGHSTGCQVAMEYTVGPNPNAISTTATPAAAASATASTPDRPPLDAIILQAGISDRDCFLAHVSADEYDAGCKAAKAWVAQGRGSDILGSTELPGLMGEMFGPRPSAERLLSLAGPDGPGTGLDDYFSADIPDAMLDQTFGSLRVPVLVLLSGSDEHMVGRDEEKVELLKRWQAAVTRNGSVWGSQSAVVQGASHNLNRTPMSVAELVRRVDGFVEDVAGLGSGGEKGRL